VARIEIIIRPAFSSRVILVSRSAARSAAGKVGFSYGSMAPLPLRSRNAIPSGETMRSRVGMRTSLPVRSKSFILNEP
jgi:hypothetical protein